jgi:hypothetical protein
MTTLTTPTWINSKVWFHFDRRGFGLSGFFLLILHVPIMLAVGGDGVGGDGWIIGT